MQIFPTAQIAIGPAIENGFYYDFDLPRPLSSEDLEEVTKRMKQIIKEDKEFKRIVVHAKARKMFADQHYKIEIT